jgi:MoxR-like ATPase
MTTNGKVSVSRRTVTERSTTGIPFADDPRLSSPSGVREGLASVGYLAEDRTARSVSLAARMSKPLLLEGPAGTGKTQLAKSVAELTGARLLRLQCYEGMDESKALYEWDYRRQLLWIQSAETSHDEAWTDGGGGSLFGERFLLTRPLLEAIVSPVPVVLLIDEVDRVDVEAEALFLEVLSDLQVSIPEMGTLSARTTPLVFLTSNNTRNLSEALKRRCLYLHLDYPTVERERDIILRHVPEIGLQIAGKLSAVLQSLRQLDLKKRPSISETIDFARSLLLLDIGDLDQEAVRDGLDILLKYDRDIETAQKALQGFEL